VAKAGAVSLLHRCGGENPPPPPPLVDFRDYAHTVTEFCQFLPQLQIAGPKGWPRMRHFVFGAAKVVSRKFAADNRGDNVGALLWERPEAWARCARRCPCGRPRHHEQNQGAKPGVSGARGRVITTPAGNQGDRHPVGGPGARAGLLPAGPADLMIARTPTRSRISSEIKVGGRHSERPFVARRLGLSVSAGMSRRKSVRS